MHHMQSLARTCAVHKSGDVGPVSLKCNLSVHMAELIWQQKAAMFSIENSLDHHKTTFHWEGLYVVSSQLPGGSQAT